MAKYVIQPEGGGMVATADDLGSALEAAWHSQRYHERDVEIYELHDDVPALMAVLSLKWYAGSDDDA
jgi:hypothetical protein